MSSGNPPSIQRPGQGPFLVPEEVPANLVQCGRELSRTEERARYSAQNQFEAAKQWRAVNLWLGGGTAAMSALAGVMTFASDDLRFWAGGAAVLAAIMAAVMTTVAPERRGSRAEHAANEYLAIQTEARQHLLLHLTTAKERDVEAVVRRLSSAADQINRVSDPPGKKARRRAAQNIEEGGQVYGVDET